jgi:hypothetical protein
VIVSILQPPSSLSGTMLVSALPNGWNNDRFQPATPSPLDGTIIVSALPNGWNNDRFQPATPILLDGTMLVSASAPSSHPQNGKMIVSIWQLLF